MSQLESLASRRAGDGFGARDLLKADREWVACFTCRRKHPLRGNCADLDYRDFAARHPLNRGCVVTRISPEYLERRSRRAEARKRQQQVATQDFLHNASVLEAFGAATPLDLTGFTTASGLASSATAGWSSMYVANVPGLYLDYAAELFITTLTGTPANNLALNVYTAGVNATKFTVTSANATIGATYTNNGATFTVLSTIAAGTTLYLLGNGAPTASGTLTKATGTGDATITFSAFVPVAPQNTAGTALPTSATTSATVTFLTVASNPTGFKQIATFPYVTSGDIVNPGAFNCAQAYCGNLPQYLWWPVINYTGQTAKPTFFTVVPIYTTVA